MERSIEEWKSRFRGKSVDRTILMWSSKAARKSSWAQEPNFHVAAAERMRSLGNMAIDLDRKTRLKLCRQADEIITRVQEVLVIETERLKEIEKTLEKSDAYFKKYGTRTARYYMYEQGRIDRLGDKIEIVREAI